MTPRKPKEINYVYEAVKEALGLNGRLLEEEEESQIEAEYEK